MTKIFSRSLVAGTVLLLASLTSVHAQYARGGSRLGAFAGGGAGRAGAIGSAPGARGYSGATFRGNRGYYGGRGGYYGGRSRYFHRGSYYYYDPFLFGGFGYPYYYGYGFGPGFGLGYYGPVGYGYDGYGYGDGDGYYGDRVYNGRIASEVNGGRRRGNGDEGDERGGGAYSPSSMARAVQGELKERGYYRGRVDGEFGVGTAEALRNFQRDKGLKVTGRLDERTLKALGFDQR